jgi:hypothetical protein
MTELTPLKYWLISYCYLTLVVLATTVIESIHFLQYHLSYVPTVGLGLYSAAAISISIKQGSQSPKLF